MDDLFASRMRELRQAREGERAAAAAAAAPRSESRNEGDPFAGVDSSDDERGYASHHSSEDGCSTGDPTDS